MKPQIVINQLIRLSFLCGVMLFGLTSNTLLAQYLPSDSIVVVKELNEIVVIAPETIVVGNKSVYYPTKELKEATATCIQLLSGLQIPDLIVNPATGNISLFGGGRLSVRINGRPASETDLASIASKDITKMEYLANPGIRYGEVDGVLDISVKRRESGYGVMLNLLQSPNRGWGNYVGALKYNTKRSEWTLDYNSNPMWDMDCYRDNTERIVLADGTMVERIESGIKTPNRMVTHHASLQYSYAEGSKLLFNAQARLVRRNDKYVSTGDITTVMGGVTSTGFEQETAPAKSWQTDLDLYLHYKINKNHKVFFNVVPTYIDGRSERSFETTDTKIRSDLSSHSCHLLAEGIWEGRVGRGTFSSGIRNTNEWTNATYHTQHQKVKETVSTVYTFAEWKQTAEKLQYTIGLGGTLFAIRRPVSYTSTFVNPRLFVRYRPFEWGSVAISLNVRTVSPSVNEMNPALQQIDVFQWSQGNMNLSPYQRYESKIEFDGKFNRVTAKLSFSDRYSHHPIMSAKMYCDGEIVKSYFNAGYNNDFETKGQARLPLFIKQLTLSVEGGWHTMISKGVNYRHSYSQPFVNAQLMYIAGPWWIMLKYNNAYNVLWGEMIASVNQNLFNIGAGYTYKQATFMAGIVNPVGNVALNTRDLSEKAGYDRVYQASGSRQLVWLGVSLNLHKGKKRSATQKKLDNKNTYESIKNIMK